MFGYDYSVMISELENAISNGTVDLYDTVLIERDEDAILDYYPIKKWHFSEHQYSLADVDITQLETILDAIALVEEEFEDMEEISVSTVLKEMREKSARLNASIVQRH